MIKFHDFPRFSNATKTEFLHHNEIILTDRGRVGQRIDNCLVPPLGVAVKETTKVQLVICSGTSTN